jgi:hypothetical protein
MTHPTRERPQWPAKPAQRSALDLYHIVLLVLGWLALLYGTAQPLLAAIQIDAIGIGALITALTLKRH